MALEDLIQDPEEEFEGVEQEEEEASIEDDLTESLTLLEDARELLITLLDPKLWEGKYITAYIRREIGKLETEILQFTDQWKMPEDGQGGEV